MIENLTKREKLLIVAGAVIVALLLVVIIIKKMVSWRLDYSDRANQTRSQINKIEEIINKYKYYKTLQTGSGDNDVNDIYPKLDPILVRHSLKSNVSSMKDTSTVVMKKYNKIVISINLKSVALLNVFRFIYDIEKNNQINAKIEYFKFRKPFADKDTYDVDIKLASYSLLNGVK